MFAQPKSAPITLGYFTQSAGTATVAYGWSLAHHCGGKYDLSGTGVLNASDEHIHTEISRSPAEPIILCSTAITVCFPSEPTSVESERILSKAPDS